MYANDNSSYYSVPMLSNMSDMKVHTSTLQTHFMLSLLLPGLLSCHARVLPPLESQQGLQNYSLLYACKCMYIHQLERE